MSPPVPQICQQCHTTRDTSPTMPELQVLAEGKETPLSPEHCGAFERWAQRVPQLEVSPDSPLPPWWVRHQYESTRNHAATFRIWVDEASLELFLRPRSTGEVPLSTSLGDRAPDPDYFEIQADTESSLRFFLNVEENQILLRSQEFFRAENVLLDGIGTWNMEDPSIRVDEEGMVHLEFDLPWTWWPWNGHRDLILNSDPRPQVFGPIYWGLRQINDLVRACGGDGHDHLDPLEDQPVPPSSDLEAFLRNLINRSPSNSSSDDAPSLSQILSHFRPGSRLTINPLELSDFYLPGILDLGASSAQVEVYLGEGGELEADIDDISIRLDDMAYTGTDATNASVILRGGHITSGPLDPIEGVERVAPGIHLRFNTEEGILSLGFNLRAQLGLTAPGVGDLQIRTDLMGQTRWDLSGETPQLIPGSTQITFQNLDITQFGEENSHVYLGEVVIQDFPIDGEPLSQNLNQVLGNPQFNIRVRLEEDTDAQYLANGFVQIPTDSEGNYQLENLLQSLSGEVSLENITSDGTVYLSGIQFSPQNYWYDRTRGEIPGYQVGFNLDRVQARRGFESLVQGGALEVGWFQDENEHNHYLVGLRANQYQSGRVHLNDLQAEVEIDQFSVENGVTTVRVPQILITANPRGSRRGMLRGPIRIEQQEGHQLQVFWEGETRHLELRDLALLARLRGIQLPENLRAFLDPNVASLGVDGRLQGHLQADLSGEMETWNAHGLIQARGDQRGDVYWLNRGGRPVGPPLIRNTRWRWMRVDRLNTRRAYALGRFHLDTLINLGALMQFSNPEYDRQLEGATVMYGLNGQALEPYEINAVMPYDNQPASGEGFINRILDYLVTLYRQTQMAEALATQATEERGED